MRARKKARRRPDAGTGVAYTVAEPTQHRLTLLALVVAWRRHSLSAFESIRRPPPCPATDCNPHLWPAWLCVRERRRRARQTPLLVTSAGGPAVGCLSRVKLCLRVGVGSECVATRGGASSPPLTHTLTHSEQSEKM
jgi:CelD/BcsL family acetyltransferase involved in cellulose biosynthesis